MANALRIALIGCGWAGARHAGTYAAGGATLRWAIGCQRGTRVR